MLTINKIRILLTTWIVLIWFYWSQVYSAFWIDNTLAVEWATQTTFKTAVISVVNYFLWFLGLLALAFIITAWVKMVMSDWEQKVVEKSQKTIIYSIIWIVIIILSYSIVRIIGDISIQ